MKISYHSQKRHKILAERGIDFEDAVEVFAGPTFDGADLRFDYGEERMITVGYLRGRMMIVVWTPRANARHIISMRKANEKEQKRFRNKLV